MQPDPFRSDPDRERSLPTQFGDVLHRARRWLRRPSVWWLIAVALVLTTTAVLSELTASARATIDRYGERIEVPVATRRIDPGDEIAGRVRWESRPIGVVPEGAVLELAGDEIAIASLVPGEVVVAVRLADAGSGAAALLPAGTAGLALPIATRPPLGVGDLVDVVATFDPVVAAGRSPTAVVAKRAVVIDLRDEIVTVAVRATELDATAFAVSQGRLVLALVSPA